MAEVGGIKKKQKRFYLLSFFLSKTLKLKMHPKKLKILGDSLPIKIVYLYLKMVFQK